MMPSMEKTPSVAIRLARAVGLGLLQLRFQLGHVALAKR